MFKFLWIFALAITYIIWSIMSVVNMYKEYKDLSPRDSFNDYLTYLESYTTIWLVITIGGSLAASFISWLIWMFD